MATRFSLQPFLTMRKRAFCYANPSQAGFERQITLPALTGMTLIHIIVLIRICYGRYNSFRDKRIGMQDIRELPQFVSLKRSVVFPELFA